MSKKLIASLSIAVVLVLAVSLVAAGGRQTEADEAENEVFITNVNTAEPGPQTVGFETDADQPGPQMSGIETEADEEENAFNVANINTAQTGPQTVGFQTEAAQPGRQTSGRQILESKAEERPTEPDEPDEPERQSPDSRISLSVNCPY